MTKTILTTLILGTLTISSSFAATTILDCHVEGWEQNKIEIIANIKTVKLLSNGRMFRGGTAQLVGSNIESSLEVTISRYPHKNTCMVYTYITGEDFSVKNDPCGHKRVFTGEFRGDKVSCVLNSL